MDESVWPYDLLFCASQISKFKTEASTSYATNVLEDKSNDNNNLW